MTGKIVPLLGSLLVLLVLLPACAGTEEQPPAAAPTAPQATTPPGAAVPATVAAIAAAPDATPQVQGARSTPGTPGGHQAGEALLRDMERVQERLRELAERGPEDRELIQVTEQASDLANELSERYLEMDAERREDALAEMAQTLGYLAQAGQAETTQAQPAGPLAPGQRPGQAESGPATGAQMALTPSPRSPFPGHSQLMEEVRGLRLETREASARRPAREDLLRPLGEIREVLLTIRAQASGMDERDAAQLLGEVAGAMQDVLELVRTIVQQENQAVPGQRGTPGRLP